MFRPARASQFGIDNALVWVALVVGGGDCSNLGQKWIWTATPRKRWKNSLQHSSQYHASQASSVKPSTFLHCWCPRKPHARPGTRSPKSIAGSHQHHHVLQQYGSDAFLVSCCCCVIWEPGLQIILAQSHCTPIFGINVPSPSSHSRVLFPGSQGCALDSTAAVS